MGMVELTLRSGHVVEGAILPERVEVVVATQEGELLHLVGKGLKTGQFVDRRLTSAQLATLTVIGGEGDFMWIPTHSERSFRSIPNSDSDVFEHPGEEADGSYGVR